MPRFLSAKVDAGLIPLPWDLPLADWPNQYLVALPRGLSRHVVRFITVNGSVYAAKEVVEHLAIREYRLLHDLTRLGEPTVEPVGVVTGRTDQNGNPLDSVLITKHLEFALPYRGLFAPGVRHETVMRLLDAMVVLLARLHLAGFMWGDVSLSNILFRRDAGAFAAYLVDAETGELHDQLSDGQRLNDLEIGRVNVYGDFCDLQAGGLLDPSLDPLDLVDTIDARYAELWNELTGRESFSGTELDRIEGRVRRLNALGFDVAELDITTSQDGERITIQPKVVDAGHHSRRLFRLTGLDTEENQARRLLNDLDSFRMRTNQQHVDEMVVAHQWLTDCFEPVIAAVPPELSGKRDPAQIYHELLDYRWYQSQNENREVPLMEAVTGYIRDVLSQLPDEAMNPAAMQQVIQGDTRFQPAGVSADVGAEEGVDMDGADISNDTDRDAEEPIVDPWEQALAEVDLAGADRLDIDALRAKARDGA